MLLNDEVYSANVLADVALQVSQIWTGYEMSVNRFVGGRGRGYKTMVECTWEMQMYGDLESLGNKTGHTFR